MIKEITEAEAISFVTDKKDLTFCKSTKYYALFMDEIMVGVTGIVFMKNKVVFKNHWIPHEFRGKGFFKILLSWSFYHVIIEKGYNVIEATCTKMSIREYLRKGFRPVKQFKNYTKVRYENLP